MASLFPRPCPQLPDYRSLLVKGLYHASAPVHLLLSHNTDDPEARAIFLTPRRDAIKNDLIDLNDAWISEYSGRGRNAAAAQRIETLYVGASITRMSPGINVQCVVTLRALLTFVCCCLCFTSTMTCCTMQRRRWTPHRRCLSYMRSPNTSPPKLRTRRTHMLYMVTLPSDHEFCTGFLPTCPSYHPQWLSRRRGHLVGKRMWHPMTASSLNTRTAGQYRDWWSSTPGWAGLNCLS